MIAAVLTAVALAAVVSAGCADQALFDCDYDSDCFGEEYCINNQCRVECSRDEDCPAGTYCGAYQRDGQPDPVQVCLTPEESKQGCESDEQCRQRFNDADARCGIHDRCVLTSTEDQENSANGAAANQDENETPDEPDDALILVVEQLDADGESAVEPVRIAAVVVRDDGDSLIGSGELLDVETTGDDGDDDHADAGMTYPLDETGTCVSEPKTADHTSLGGPGGIAYIHLTGDFELPVDDDTSWTVDIIANGPYCPLGGFLSDAPEEYGQYRALICQTDGPAAMVEPDECEHQFQGPYRGFTELQVTFEQ